MTNMFEIKGVVMDLTLRSSSRLPGLKTLQEHQDLKNNLEKTIHNLNSLLLPELFAYFFYSFFLGSQAPLWWSAVYETQIPPLKK